MKKLMMVALCALGVNVALADPSVTINKVESVYPWKGAISVEYTLDGLDSGFRYQVAFEITADGRTAGVTNAAAQLVNQSYTKTIDTVALFGKEVVDKKAEVKITLIALPIGIQLWEGGPIWAEGDAASWKNWYDAQKAVSAPWRLPTKQELEKLIDTSVCTRQYDGTKNRWTFTGVGKYEVNSISLNGYPGCWSSTDRNSDQAFILFIDFESLNLDAGDKDGETYNVRAVRDATDLDVGVSATVAATAAAEFWLGPTDVAVALAEGPGYRYVVSNLTDEVEIAPTEVGGTTYLLPIGVKVGIYCVPKNEDYAVIGKNPYLINEVEFGTTIDPTELPTAGGKPGTEVNPWKVGDGVMAHVKDGTLVITGSGAMYDFASAADAPWAGVAGTITAVTIADTVTHVGKNALAAFVDTVTVNGTPLSFYDMMADARGLTAPAVPSGAISGAEPEWIKIVDGKVLLGVSVCTNGDVTAATEDWEPAAIEKAQVEEDGTVTLTVPATAEKGFMILKSKGAEK